MFIFFLVIMSENWSSIFDEGTEIFSNQLFEKLPATVGLKKLFEQNSHLLNEVLSIKIDPEVIWGGENAFPSKYYNIETEKFKTLISHHNHHNRDKDFFFSQVHKQNWLEEQYIPYSMDGLNFYIQMLLAYYTRQNEQDKSEEGWKIKIPKLDFSFANVKYWNDCEREGNSDTRHQLLDMFTCSDVIDFFHGKNNFFQTDQNGIQRIIFPKENAEEWTGFWIKGEESIFRFPEDFNRDTISEITLENDLLPLYAQAFSDAYIAKIQGGAETKKLFEVTKYLLEHQAFGDIFFHWLTEAMKETPLTEN